MVSAFSLFRERVRMWFPCGSLVPPHCVGVCGVGRRGWVEITYRPACRACRRSMARSRTYGMAPGEDLTGRGPNLAKLKRAEIRTWLVDGGIVSAEQARACVGGGWAGCE